MLVALVPLLAVAASGTGDYPSADVLRAFSEVCQAKPNLGELVTTAKMLGWVEFKPEKGSPIDLGIHMIGSPLAGGGPDPEAVETLRRTVSGRDLQLLLIHYATIAGDDEFTGGFACHVSDFGATRPLDNTAISQWAGRAPTPKGATPTTEGTGSKVLPANMMPVFKDWVPGLSPNTRRTSIVYTPTGSFFNGGGMVGISVLSDWDEGQKAR